MAKAKTAAAKKTAESKASVMEKYPGAFCRHSYTGRYIIYRNRAAVEVIAKGHSAGIAWRDAADRVRAEEGAITTVLFKFKDRIDADRAFSIIDTSLNSVTGICNAKTVTIHDADRAYAGWFAGELVQRCYDFKVEAE